MSDSSSTRLSIARCRELLGHDADGLSDEPVADVSDHANAMAHVIVDLFLEQHAARAKDDDDTAD